LSRVQAFECSASALSVCFDAGCRSPSPERVTRNEQDQCTFGCVTQEVAVKQLVLILVGTSLLLGGCSTRPRTYQPMLSMPATDANAYERDLANCRSLVASGKRSEFGPAVAATGVGVAAGYGAGAATVATGAVPVGIGMSATAGIAVLSIMPLAGIAAGVGVTKAIRKSNEKKINAAMTDCLAAHGHSVASWQLTKKARNVSPGVEPKD
jgi:hypothetical protein